jgi:hypothetical protein
MQFVNLIVLLVALLVLAGCKQQQETATLPQPKEYWALETRYFDTKEGRWKPDQQLLSDRINLINQDKAKAFELDTKYGSLQVAKNFAGISALENKGVAVRAIASTETEVEREPTYIKTIRLQITYQPNSLEQSEKTITGSLPLFNSQRAAYYQQVDTYTPIDVSLEGVSSAGYMKVPLVNVTSLKRQIELSPPLRKDPPILLAPVIALFDVALGHPKLSLFALCCTVLILTLVTYSKHQKLHQQRRLAAKAEKAKKELLASPEALQFIQRDIEAALEPKGGFAPESVYGRLIQLTELETCRQHWLQSSSSYVRSSTQKQVSTAKTKLLKKPLQETSYLDWFQAVQFAKGASKHCEALRLIHKWENDKLYNKTNWSLQEVEHSLRGFTSDLAAYAQVSRKSFLEFLFCLETTLEWGVREQLIDSLEELTSKIAYFTELRRILQQISCADPQAGVEHFIKIRRENLAELGLRAATGRIAKDNLYEMGSGAASRHNLQEAVTTTQITEEQLKQARAQDEIRKMGKTSMAQDVEDLAELYQESSQLDTKHKANRRLRSDIKDIHEGKKKKIIERSRQLKSESLR